MATQTYRSSEGGPKIDVWKKPKKVIYTEREMGNNFLQVSVEIQQPVLSNGRDGFYKLSTMIKSNDHFIRLTPMAIIELMDILEMNREKILDAANYVRDENDIIRNDKEKPKRQRDR